MDSSYPIIDWDRADCGPAHDRAVLPFVDRPSYWAVAETGDWGADARKGETFALCLIDELRSGGGGELLSWAIRDMIARGRYSGLEAGFMSALAREIGRGSIQNHADEADHD